MVSNPKYREPKSRAKADELNQPRLGGITNFSLLDKIEIYKNKTIIPPKKTKTSAFIIHKEIAWCTRAPNIKDKNISLKHKTSGLVIKTLISSALKKIKLI